MTTTSTPVAFGSTSAPRIADDILSDQGGVIKRRGPLVTRQNVDNGFPQLRQHMGGTGDFRPAMSIGDYPEGLWLQSVGQDADGYGSRDSGTGTYVNLGRDREDIWQTQSWWIGLKGYSPSTMPATITVWNDTEGWCQPGQDPTTVIRSYYAAEINLTTGEVKIRPNGGGVTLSVGFVPVPGWNDNKYDLHYLSFTTWHGKSAGATGATFGQYGALQFGGTVLDLRTAGGGWAGYNPSAIDQPGSSFSGGNNPGLSTSAPGAGRHGGLVIYDFAVTKGDTL